MGVDVGSIYLKSLRPRMRFWNHGPVQANIYMTHESNDDLCRALVRKKLTFSLQPLKEAFRAPLPQKRIP